MKNPAKILVVEDDGTLRDIYTNLLKDEGYQVDSAFDGSHALEKMRMGGWDLVLLDIMLPDIDGYNLMNALRDVPPSKPVGPIVFLTNLSGEDNVEKGLEKDGVKGYWVKSELTPGQIIQKVKGLLAEYRK